MLVDKFIDQIAVIADEKKFVSALIMPDYRTAGGICKGTTTSVCSDEDRCARTNKIQ